MITPAGLAVVVPIKSWATAKARLAGALTPAEREQLALRCATTVLAAARPLPVFVVCDDAAVASWAVSQGATVVTPTGSGLNSAVASGRQAAHRAGYARVLVVHSDLPNATDLASLDDHSAEVIVVPDRHHDGTNALLVPSDGAFEFCYGPGSFDAHCAKAQQLGLSLRVVDRPDLALDLDTLDDLRAAGL